MADAPSLSDFLAKKTKKKIKGSNLNVVSASTPETAKKPKSKDAEEEGWQEEQVVAATMKVEVAGKLTREEDKKEEDDTSGHAWGSVKAKSESSQGLSDKKYPTLRKSMRTSTNINIDDGSEAKVNISTSKNVFAALENEEDDEEQEVKRPKEIKPAMVTKKKGELEKVAIQREVNKYSKDGPKKEGGKDGKDDDEEDEGEAEEDATEERQEEVEAKKPEAKKKDKKAEKKAEAAGGEAAREEEGKDDDEEDEGEAEEDATEERQEEVEAKKPEAKKKDKKAEKKAEAAGGEAAREEEEQELEDLKIVADLAAAKAKYEGRKKPFPPKPLPKSELEEEKENKPAAPGKKKKMAVIEEDDKPKLQFWEGDDLGAKGGLGESESSGAARIGNDNSAGDGTAVIADGDVRQHEAWAATVRRQTHQPACVAWEPLGLNTAL
eukprot:CAMPEP_0175242500 /NCGR_PEP_ID=MMETSP0093-20121207/31098_1 /TAXON_ID=311494 /ORGANISM="Alexandrium monilatum, Strain CCMP3105" /LENGTH=436 /DNA_ID=CAMNT_0016536573 /DNA_START=42 /DNA_END=1354 /DNA_ORIENTATION=-